MLTPQLRELAKLQEKATSGPWEIICEALAVAVKIPGPEDALGAFGVGVQAGCDAAFIVAARSIPWPDVVAEWERLETATARMRHALEQIAAHECIPIVATIARRALDGK